MEPMEAGTTAKQLVGFLRVITSSLRRYLRKSCSLDRRTCNFIVFAERETRVTCASLSSESVGVFIFKIQRAVVDNMCNV